MNHHPSSLPRYERTRPTFSETFERDHYDTIAAMDLSGHDIPNQKPETRLQLRRVGVKRRAIPVLINDPFGGDAVVQIACSVAADVALEPNRRGIHVSRIGNLLAQQAGNVFPSLTEYAARAAELLRQSQQSSAASVAVEGVFTYLERVSGVKEKASLEHLDLFASAAASDDGMIKSCGLGFSHITACPCVQETYRNSFAPDTMAIARNGHEVPLLTHTQRCQTRIRIANLSTPVMLRDLLRCIDEVVVRSQNTLPREFELLNVYRAHARPQFLEDALRDLLFAVYKARSGRPSEENIAITSVSMESIHDYDMEGEIAFDVKELDRIFAQPNGSASMLPAVATALPLQQNGARHRSETVPAAR